MDSIFTKAYARKAFFGLVGLLSAIALIVRYGVLPFASDSVKVNPAVLAANFLDSFVISLIVSTLIGAFIFFITPTIIRKSQIETVEPRELRDHFERSFQSADFWWYKGGCGRYFRTRTLPKMAEWARAKSLSREVRVVVLDPLNDSLCDAHARFRQSTASGKLSPPWTPQKVKDEIYATIVAVLVTQSNEPMLRINLSLAAHYSAFRIDLSNNIAIVTKEDRQAPAIICQPDNYYYKSYKDEITLTESQSRRVTQVNLENLELKSLSPEQVKSALSQAHLAGESMTTDDFQRIATICKEAKNPYE
ncbi:hypothetical protein I5U23_09850 [Stenotrophomonas maltophilia]|uniref:Uncharacterized protein n=1 Tax=Stenotrophomonas riyadhensis TaxID=2859893 RepID=A0ABT2XHH4_9GAMM|nr:hypothetical protein [Stenotrophomonas sp. CFS3442]MBH1618217.1 hypothetical protein [Stenotrophomonas maltophilia]MCV0325394.1 hypothetical protein [Stenotrophomonas sp. CFS3442]HEL4244406.1 hypothetical protein [Stenotrophomonas maltophilia]